MLRKASEAGSEGNGPIPQREEFGSGQPTRADEFREITSLLKQRNEMLEEFRDEMMGLFEQLKACPEHEARQSRLAM